MNPYRFLPVSLVLAGCSPSGSYSGKLVDAISGEARSGVRILAKAPMSLDLSCQVREARSAEDGSFVFDDLCAENYLLSMGEPNLDLAGEPMADGTVKNTEVQAVHVWRSPPAAGLFLLVDDELKALRTFSDVSQERMKTADKRKVRYPDIKPIRVPNVPEGGHLVISGKVNNKYLEILPLVADPEKRRFAHGVSIEDHVYIGVRFKSDWLAEDVNADVDEAHVRNIILGVHPVRYIGHDALPAGRYAILRPKDRRTYVVQFGEDQDD